LNKEEIPASREAVIKQHGPWTTHNIHLGGGLYTFDQTRPDFHQQLNGYANALRRMLQIAADLSTKPLNQLRVLDLACLEGIYALEFALHGAEVVGVEIREAHLGKARFAQAALGLNNVEFVQDDVRNLNAEKYGLFDVVLCIGILYHLDAPDCFQFVESMFEVCKGVTIIDTHVGLNPNRVHTFKGREYHGWGYTEHAPSSSDAEKRKNAWASIDNPKSFWLTRASLYNLLADVGFTSVYDVQNPALPGQFSDRDTLVAVKGQNIAVRSVEPNDGKAARWSEVLRLPPQGNQDETLIGRQIGRVKRVVRRVLRG
jgi:2-polyprenyl-3-methyl-5-hydroxy-6-metoxy-1,4-benzoquinol methylase